MATLYVGSSQSYQTIADAVSAASNGDTIVVIGSEYTATGEKLNINKSLTLQADGTVVVDSFGVGTGTANPNDLVIKGFTFKPTANNVYANNTSGIYQAGSNMNSLTVEDCVFDLTGIAADTKGYGIFFSLNFCGMDTMTVSGCTFTGNGSTTDASARSAVYAAYQTNVNFSDNTVSDFGSNAFQLSLTGKVWQYNGEAEVIIDGNNISDCGDCGIYAADIQNNNTVFEITDNVMTNVQADYAQAYRGAIRIGSSTVSGITITGNEINGANVGVYQGATLKEGAEGEIAISGNTFIVHEQGDIPASAVNEYVDGEVVEAEYAGNTLTVVEAPSNIIVDAAITGNDGDIITIDGKNYIIGGNAFASLTDAVNGASATGKTTITLTAGTYSEDLTFDTAVMAQKGDIEFVAAEGAEVILSGLVTLGCYERGTTNVRAWNAAVGFTGITFDQAEDGKHSFSVQNIKNGGFSLTGCTIIGDGEYGIGSNSGCLAYDSKITGCTFESASIQILGNFGTGLVIDGCTFNESRVNAQSGNSISILNSVFNATLTESNVGDSFYCIRSNDNAFIIKGCEFNIDSELADVAADQAKWGILWQRGAGSTQWVATDIQVNLTDAALLQTGLLINKNGTTTAANAADRVAIYGFTSDSDTAALLAQTEGYLKVVCGETYYLYNNGSPLLQTSVATLYVNNNFNEEDMLPGMVLGINAFTSLDAAAEFAAAATPQGKIEIMEGATATSGKYTFMNADPGSDYSFYDKLTDTENYDMDVKGTLKVGQIVWNNADFAIAKTGFVKTSEALRVMGGDLTITGNRAAGEAVPEDLVNKNWGSTVTSSDAVSAQVGYFQVGLGAEAVVTDAYIIVTAGSVDVGWAVNAETAQASSLTLENSYLLAGNQGSYGASYLTVRNGSTLTANNSTITRAEGFSGFQTTMHVTIDAASTFTLNGSNIVATSLAANGAFNVTGASTLVIDTLTGYANLYDGSITDSTIGGSVKVTGDASFKGENSIAGTLKVTNGATLTIGEDSVLTNTGNYIFIGDTNYGADYLDLGGNGETAGGKMIVAGTLNTSGEYLNVTANGRLTITETGKVNAVIINVETADVETEDVTAGILDVDGAVVTTMMDVRKGGVATIDGSVDFIGQGAYGFIVRNNGAVTVTGKVGINAYKSNFDDYKLMNIKSGAVVTLDGGTIDFVIDALKGTQDITTTVKLEDAELVLLNGGTFKGENILATEETKITLDASSSFTATTIEGAAAITIDAAAFVSGFKKVIDLAGASSLEGKVTINNKADNVKVIYGADGDVTLTDADMSKLYVNSAYADMEFGATIEGLDGVYVGINAFAKLSDAMNTGIKKIVVQSDITDSFAGIHGVNISTDAADGVTITNTYGGWLYFADGSTIGENVALNNMNGPFFFYNNNTIEGDITVLAPYTRYNGTLTITETGSMTFSEQFVIRYADNAEAPLIDIQGNAALGAAEEDRTAQLISNRGYMTFYSGTINAANTLVKGGHLQMTQTTDAGYSAIPAIINLDNTIWYASSNDIEAAELNGKAIINAKNQSVLNLNDDLMLNGAETALNLTDSKLIITNGGITNKGTVTINGSTVSANSVVNSGSMSISGESSVTIGDLNSEASALLLEDAALTASSIAGSKAYIDVKGTNTFDGTLNALWVKVGDVEEGAYAGSLSFSKDSSVKAAVLQIAKGGSVTYGSADETYANAFGVTELYAGEGSELTIQNVAAESKIPVLFAQGKVVIDNADIKGNDLVLGNSTGDAEMLIKDSKAVFGGASNAVVIFGDAAGGKLTLENSEVTINRVGPGSSWRDTEPNVLTVGYHDGAATINVNNSTLVVNNGIAVNANSAITIDGSSFTAGAITNNGTIKVTGESTLQIDSLSGKQLRLENATLGDSYIGGDIFAFDDVVFAGTVTGKQINMCGNTTINDGASYTGSITIVGTGGELTLENGGSIDSRFLNVMGTADLAGSVYLHHSDPKQKMLQVFEGGIANINDGAEFVINGHNALVKEGGTLNVNGGLLDIQRWTGRVVGGILYNEGAVVVKGNGTLQAAAIEGAGSITIDGSDFTGTRKLIDLAGTESLAGKVELINGEGLNLIYGADGDVTLTDQQTSTVYVDSTYTGLQLGETTADGKIYGFNAFDSLDYTAAEDTTALEIAAGTYSQPEGNFSNAVSVIKGGITSVTTDGEVIVDKGSLIFATEAAGEVTISGTYTTTDKIRYTGTWGVDWAEVQNGHIRFIGGNDTIFKIDGSFTSGENIQFIGGSAIISESSVLTVSNLNYGQILVSGAAVTNYGKMNLDLDNFNGSAMNILNGGSFTLSGANAELNLNMLDGGANNKDLNVTNGSLIVKDGAKLTATGVITIGASGRVEVTNAEISGTIVNNGTFVAGGESKFNFALTGNESFTFADGAVLATGSAITGSGSILAEGDFSMDLGAITGVILTVNGDLTLTGTLDFTNADTEAGAFLYDNILLGENGVLVSVGGYELSADNYFSVNDQAYQVVIDGSSAAIKAITDTANPVITSIKAKQTFANGKTVIVVIATATDDTAVSKMTCTVDGIETPVEMLYNSVTGCYEVAIELADSTSDGTFKYHVTAEDFSGNTATLDNEMDYFGDRVAPGITVGEISDVITNEDVIVSVSAYDNSGALAVFKYQINDGEWIDVEGFTTDITMVENGTITIVVKDAAGYETTETVEITNIDKVAPDAPVVTFDAATTNDPLTLSFSSASDDVVKTIVTDAEGNVINEFEGAAGELVVENNGTYTFTAYDKAGNSTATETVVENIVHKALVNIWEGDVVVEAADTLQGSLIEAPQWLEVLAGGTAEEATINNKGYAKVWGAFNDSTVEGTLTEAGWAVGSIHLYKGATASGNTVNEGGKMNVGGGVDAIGTTINGGQVKVWAGGSATDTTITAGGLVLDNKTSAENTVISVDGRLHIYDGATATNNTISGYVGVGKGGQLIDNTFEAGASVTVWAHGYVENSQINKGTLILNSGAVANKTVMAGGSVHIYKGATAFSTTVENASINVGKDGLLYSVTVETGASVNLYNGAILRGWNVIKGDVDFAAGNSTANAVGAMFVFDLSEREAESDVMLENLAGFEGAEYFLLADPEKLAEGRFNLGGYAEGFDDSVTIVGTQTEIHLDSVTAWKGFEFSLGVSDSNELYIDIVKTNQGSLAVL